jgi:hypothetical protein
MRCIPPFPALAAFFLLLHPAEANAWSAANGERAGGKPDQGAVAGPVRRPYSCSPPTGQSPEPVVRTVRSVLPEPLRRIGLGHSQF